MGREDARHPSVSREWGKVLLPQPFQMTKTCCSFPSVLQNLQPSAWKIGILLFTLISTELSGTSSAWSRGAEMVHDELGNWLLYWRIFWYFHYSFFCYTSLLRSSVLGWFGTAAWTEGDYITAFLMAMQGDVLHAYCSVMDKVSQKLSPDNSCA